MRIWWIYSDRSPAQIVITILCCRDSSPPFRVSHHGLCQCQGLIITPQSTLHIGGSSLPDTGDPSPLPHNLHHTTQYKYTPAIRGEQANILTNYQGSECKLHELFMGGGWADVSTSDVATVRIMGSRNKVWGSDHVRPIVWGSETCLDWRQECLWWCDISLLTPSTG